MNDIASAAGGLLGSFLVVSIVATLVVFWLLLPWFVISVVRNISRTRKALERIADALDASPRVGGGNVLGL